MFSWFKKEKDISKNSAKVTEWKKEHKKMLEIFSNVLSSYKNDDTYKTKKYLADLNQVALQHLMDEDITFTKLLQQARENDQKIVDEITEFRFSFRDVKVALLKFLTKYNNPEEELDKDFLPTLTSIIDALEKRIEFEETNLYNQINN